MLKIVIFIIFQLIRVVYMIVCGQKIENIEERPFQAVINDGLFPIISGNSNCGATIISKSYVLTAAHCVKENATYIVRVGTTFSIWYGDTYKFDKIFIHPNYTTLRNDIALLKLVKPIAIANNKFPKYVDLIVEASGYGAECFGFVASRYLNEVELSTMEQKECAKYVDNLLKNQICTIDSKSKNGTGILFFYLPNILSNHSATKKNQRTTQRQL